MKKLICALMFLCLSAFADININTAKVKDLMVLNGIGEVRAKSIIEYRNNNGEFKSLEDLKKVKGIGNKLFELIKSEISLSDSVAKKEPGKSNNSAKVIQANK